MLVGILIMLFALFGTLTVLYTIIILGVIL
jgi:hypothetical protein